ncbi:DUF2130 domain-containing protein [Mycoplasma sp. 2248]|uniref:DUF2130 domain-containing protein n=1 Tax=Mycoplasma sp. 2248 TaxID=3108528 RepID=UPI002B1E8685|nr:DUF2130 domain-containing protein [Mycoplasma sp. 2248]MEA4191375.1 DUF2130 domain-containing protein [Mycoplasma sp. 2248]
MKEIKFKLNEERPLELIINENAYPGDIIDLSTLSSGELFALSSNINNERNYDIKKQAEKELLENLTNLPEYKVNVQGLVDEYNKKLANLQTELNKLKTSMNSTIEVEKLKLQSTKDAEIAALKSNIKNLEETKEQEIRNVKSELEITFTEKMQRQKEAYSQLNTELSELKASMNSTIEAEKSKLEVNNIKAIEKAKEEYKKELEKENQVKNNQIIEELKNNFKEQIDELKKEKIEVQNKLEAANVAIDALKTSKSLLSSKRVGENFEEQIAHLLDQYTNLDDLVDYEKTTTNIDGTKPDFLVTFYKNENNNRVKIGSVVIEAKSETENGSQKNSQFINKLIKDQKARHAETAFLVTELEKEDDFLVKIERDKDNKNQVWVIRLPFMIQMLQLQRYMFLKASEFNFVELRDKMKILEEFEQFKKKLLETRLDALNKVATDMKKQVERIQDSANALENLLTNDLERKFRYLVDEVEKFKLTKKMNKVNWDSAPQSVEAKTPHLIEGAQEAHIVEVEEE